MNKTHWISPDGRVACNPRDKEASHKAQQGKLLTSDNIKLINCKKCIKGFYRIKRLE